VVLKASVLPVSTHWDKCVNVGRGYIEKKNVFLYRVRMSHVLRFISICDLYADSPLYYVRVWTGFH
jgi:hypothetical protein